MKCPPHSDTRTGDRICTEYVYVLCTEYPFTMTQRYRVWFRQSRYVHRYAMYRVLSRVCAALQSTEYRPTAFAGQDLSCCRNVDDLERIHIERAGRDGPIIIFTFVTGYALRSGKRMIDFWGLQAQLTSASAYTLIFPSYSFHEYSKLYPSSLHPHQNPRRLCRKVHKRAQTCSNAGAGIQRSATDRTSDGAALASGRGTIPPLHAHILGKLLKCRSISTMPETQA